MGYNTKNYTEQGGDKTVIGGELKIGNQGKVTFGGTTIKPATCQPDSTASTVAALKDEVNALLAKLQDAGLMERAMIVLEEDSETDNKINTLTTYSNVSSFSDAWVTDAIIISTELIPAGTEVTINNPAIGGEPYTIESPTRILWLSDVIKGQNEAASTRTKLNEHTTQAFDFTVSGLTEELTTDLEFKVVISDKADLAGTHQSEQDFGDYVILTKNTLAEVTFAAEED